MENNNYYDLAEKYDYMLSDDPARIVFFKNIMTDHNVKSLLDCSCGTGADLIMFKSFIDYVEGSDLSDPMLEVAKKKIEKSGLDIKTSKGDLRYLQSWNSMKYDAVVCLSSSMGEIHSDKDVIIGLRSMYSTLNKNGILIIDQGQSDLMMKTRPRFIPIINNRFFSRLFVIDYLDDSNKYITVNICDLEHTDDNCSFSMNPFKLRVRLFDEWKELLSKAGINSFKIYGDWKMADYSKSESRRIVIVATKPD